MIYEFYYLDDSNKECHYKGELSNRSDKLLWNKLYNSYWNYNPYHYKLHKINGPAYIRTDDFGNKRIEYFLNGSNHRDDGLCIFSDNDQIDSGLYLNGIWYNKKDFAEKTKHLICKYCNKFCKQKCF